MILWRFPAHFITKVAVHQVWGPANTNLADDCLASRDAGVENDKTSLQLDTRNNKMPDNEQGVPNNADNDKVNDSLSPLNTNAFFSTCRVFVQHFWIHDSVQLCDNTNGRHVPCFRKPSVYNCVASLQRLAKPLPEIPSPRALALSRESWCDVKSSLGLSHRGSAHRSESHWQGSGGNLHMICIIHPLVTSLEPKSMGPDGVTWL